MNKSKILWSTRGTRDAATRQSGTLDLDHVQLRATGDLGPRGISPEGADLIDLAGTVLRIERQLTGRGRTNPPAQFHLRMPVRAPNIWNSGAKHIAERLLRHLGSAEWSIELVKNPGPPSIYAGNSTSQSQVRAVMLLSGGLDSTCGAATLSPEDNVQAVSFYVRQKELQREVAQTLGLGTPVQWTWAQRVASGRGRSFYYRTLLFLCIAAVTANSWGAREILQFENGVLGLAVPPNPDFRMTLHAHPETHRLARELFAAVLGGEWSIINRFALMTKRDCYKLLEHRLGENEARELASRTETCWALRAPRAIGGSKKKPGRACGICFPCVVRQTATSREPYKFDLHKDTTRNHPLRGRVFRAYYGFLKDVESCRSATDFYSMLDSRARDLVAPVGPLELEDIFSLFRKFGGEFKRTFE